MQAFIGLGLSIGKATEKGHADYGTIAGVNHGPNVSPAAASWNIFVALGSVAFAYSFVSSSQTPYLTWNCPAAAMSIRQNHKPRNICSTSSWAWIWEGENTHCSQVVSSNAYQPYESAPKPLPVALVALMDDKASCLERSRRHRSGSISFIVFQMQSMVLIEVQDTLAQQPSEIDSMKKATGFSIAITVSHCSQSLSTALNCRDCGEEATLWQTP